MHPLPTLLRKAQRPKPDHQAHALQAQPAPRKTRRLSHPAPQQIHPQPRILQGMRSMQLIGHCGDGVDGGREAICTRIEYT